MFFQVANLREFEELNFENYYLYQNALRYYESEGIVCRYLFFIYFINNNKTGNLQNSY